MVWQKPGASVQILSTAYRPPSSEQWYSPFRDLDTSNTMTVDRRPSLAAGGSNVWAAFYSMNGGSPALRVSLSQDGYGWSSPTLVAGGLSAVPEARPAIAASGTYGVIAVNHASGQMAVYKSVTTGTNWALLSTSFPGSPEAATNPAIALDASHNPIVAWTQTDTSGVLRVRVARWDGSVWAPLADSMSEIGITPEGTSDSPGIVIGSDPTATGKQRVCVSYRSYATPLAKLRVRCFPL